MVVLVHHVHGPGGRRAADDGSDDRAHRPACESADHRAADRTRPAADTDIMLRRRFGFVSSHVRVYIRVRQIVVSHCSCLPIRGDKYWCVRPCPTRVYPGAISVKRLRTKKKKPGDIHRRASSALPYGAGLGLAAWSVTEAPVKPGADAFNVILPEFAFARTTATHVPR